VQRFVAEPKGALRSAAHGIHHCFLRHCQPMGVRRVQLWFSSAVQLAQMPFP
jgi:hypothetical protein